MLTCQGPTEPRPPGTQPKTPSHHHSPRGIESATSLRKHQGLPFWGTRKQRRWDRHNTKTRTKLGGGAWVPPGPLKGNSAQGSHEGRHPGCLSQAVRRETTPLG